MLEPKEEMREKPVHKPNVKKSKLVQTKVADKRLIDSFKSFQSGIIDFDLKAGYLGVCCEDSSLKIYKMHSETDTKSKYIMGTLSKNQPSAVCITPTGTTMYVSGTQDLQIHKFKLETKSSKPVLEQETIFTKKHTIRISTLEYTPNCIISCGEEQDTTIYFWSFNGDILGYHENKQLKHKKMCISENFKFFSIATWLGSARVFEIVKQKKTENFAGVNVVMELGGHSQGLSCVGFSPDAGLAVTCSLDRSIKLWNVNVQYQLKEAPVLLKTAHLDKNTSVPVCCSLNKNRLVLASDTHLYIYNVPTLEIIDFIQDAHATYIRKTQLLENVLFTCSADTRIHLWRID